MAQVKFGEWNVAQVNQVPIDLYQFEAINIRVEPIVNVSKTIDSDISDSSTHGNA